MMNKKSLLCLSLCLLVGSSALKAIVITVLTPPAAAVSVAAAGYYSKDSIKEMIEEMRNNKDQQKSAHLKQDITNVIKMAIIVGGASILADKGGLVQLGKCGELYAILGAYLGAALVGAKYGLGETGLRVRHAEGAAVLVTLLCVLNHTYKANA